MDSKDRSGTENPKIYGAYVIVLSSNRLHVCQPSDAHSLLHLLDFETLLQRSLGDVGDGDRFINAVAKFFNTQSIELFEYISEVADEKKSRSYGTVDEKASNGA